MKRIPAIALLTVKTAFHSKVFIALLTAVALCVIGFPMIVRGDGTLESELKLILKYSLSAAVILLSLASIWAGSASVSMEISGKQIHLVRSKPVSSLQLWLGKWLGIVVLNAALLICAAVLTYAMTIYSVVSAHRAGKDTTAAQQTILQSSAVILPQASPITLPSDALSAIDAARQDLTHERRPLEWGTSSDWSFSMPAELIERKQDFSIIFNFIASINPEQNISLQWLAEKDGIFKPVFEKSVYGAGKHSFDLPAAIIPDTGILNLRLKYLPEGDRQSLLFPDDDSVKAAFKKGSFTGNFIKSVFVLLFKLATLSALGLTAGCMFSFPVAAFMSFSIIAGYGLVSFFLWQEQGLGVNIQGCGSCAGHGGHGGFSLEHIGTHLIVFMARILAALQENDVLSMLASGTFISWPFFGRIFAAQIILLCGTLCLTGCLVFRKRELAI